ncbi:hypothetical protein [Streptomyces sp. FIT100]|uniref:hypothetical protein n=1 Tax=Streptomyces sp. FIT100 TaxID=2837956 RepID=UPI0021C9BE7A|nr:hypothetical protein [Streptomyces sp. FIT100]
MTPETRSKKSKPATTRTKRSGEASVTRKAAKSAVTGKTTKSAVSGQYRSPRLPTGSYSSSTEVAQVRLRPDEMADLRLVMQSLNLPSVSDALREGLRLLSREAAEVAASEEIRAFYQGVPAPTPAGVLPATAEELAAADEIEW